MKKALQRSLSVLLAITIIFSSAYIGLNELDFSGVFVVGTKAASEYEDFVIDSDLYPESQHSYGNSISEIYEFTYCGAQSLTLNFSSSTYVENSYDKIYIYNESGSLYGTYSGGSLSGASITLPGDSFRIKLTSDGSVVGYGFSFDSIVADVYVPAHNYSTQWTTDVEPTCAEEGSKSRHCTVCGDKTDITSIDANEHNYGAWGIVSGQSNIAQRTCSACGDIQERTSSLIIDSDCYPESDHDYGNNLSQIYEFSYCGAQSLTLNFSSSTYVESNYDKIYLYDGSGALYGTYTGGSLSGASITLTGGSFKIKLTTDVSVVKYGFSFDSIVANLDLANIIDHEYSSWITDCSPTCTSDGEKYRYCYNCSSYEYATIPTTGHSYSDQWTIDIAPSCLVDGSESRHCIECGDQTDERTVEATGHNFSNWDVVSTPDDRGNIVEESFCSNCGVRQIKCDYFVIDPDSYPESAHNYGNSLSQTYEFNFCSAQSLTLNFSSSTYVENSYDKIYIYDASGSLYGTYTGTSLSGASITLQGDSFSIKLTSDGSVTGYGFSFDSIVADLNGADHDYTSWVTNESGVCTEEGEKYRSCNACDYYESITIPATEHNYSSWYVDYSPTCTETGQNYRYCYDCNYYDYETVPATGHDYSSWMTNYSPTCTSDGENYRYCYNCGSYDYETVPATGHNYSSWMTNYSPTCTETGQNYRYCYDCYHYDYETIPAISHSYSGQWTIDIAPSCLEDGSKSHHCIECGYQTDITTIEATGHSFGYWDAISTSDDRGNIVEESFCSNCGVRQIKCDYFVIDPDSYPESSHSYGNNLSQIYDFSYCGAQSLTLNFSSSTYVENSYDKIYIYNESGSLYGTYTGSSLSGASITLSGSSFRIKLTSDGSIVEYGFSFDSIVADLYGPDHDYTSWVFDESNVCTETGEKHRSCNECTYYESEIIPATEHNYSSWYVDYSPTCTETGQNYRYCYDCNYYDYETVPATDHDYSSWMTNYSPTCTSDGENYRYCYNCGSYDYETISATGHSYSDQWTIDIAPSCLEEGSKSRHCIECGDQTDITTIEATGHSYGDWVPMSDLVNAGIDGEERTCSLCGDKQVKAENFVIDSSSYPESDHNYGDYLSEIYDFKFCGAESLTLNFSPATYVESSYDYIYIYQDNGDLYGKYTGSSLAGASITLPGDSFRIKLTSDSSYGKYGFSFDSIIANLNGSGHNYSSWSTSYLPTCSSNGEKYRCCYDCNYYDYEIIPATGHDYGSWTTNYWPTCSSTGQKYRYCYICDSYDYEDIPTIEHDYSYWYTDYSPTCTETGQNYRYCYDCYHYDYETIPTLDHDYSSWLTYYSSTCTETGQNYRYCYDCYNYDYETIPAKGHSYSTQWTIDEQSTCSSFGSKSHHCTRCSAKKDVTRIQPLEHRFKGWVTIANPTATSMGQQKNECAGCDYVDFRVICATPKLKSVTNTSSGVKFTWEKVKGAKTYAVYRKTGNGKWVLIAKDIKSNSYTDKTAKSGKTYKYSVKAATEFNVYSSYNTKGLSIKCLADPTLKTPSSTKKGIVLKWNKISGAQGYQVYRKTGSGSYSKIATVKGSTKVTYTDKSAKKGKKYTYKVKAYYSKTYSAYSNTKAIKDKY